MKKQKLFSLLLAGACACTCAVVGGMKIHTQVASAHWANDGGVDYFTDMTSNGADFEYYDTLYNSDWDIYGSGNAPEGDLPTTWNITDDKILRFTPSENNTTGSFVWSFTYTCKDAGNAINIYPLSDGAWNGSGPFDYHSCGFEAGETYEVDLGVVKLKNDSKYYVFVKVDGEFKLGQYREESDGKGNDLYFYVTGGAGTLFSQKPMDYSKYETYDVLYNEDFGLPVSWDFTTTTQEMHNFTPSAENTTGSFIWKFTYTCTQEGNGMLIYPFKNENWRGGQQIEFFNCGFEAGKTYEVELCVLKEKGASDYTIFVFVDGFSRIKETRTRAHAAECANEGCTDLSAHTGLLFWNYNGSGAGTFVSPKPIEYETYDVLYNEDFGLSKNWAIKDDTFLNFTPSAENTTGSFIWKFTYSCITPSYGMYIYPLASGGWKGATQIDFGRCDFVAGNTYEVEVCVLNIKGTSNYAVKVIVDGVTKIDEIRTRAHTGACDAGCTDVSMHTGLYFFVPGDGVAIGTGTFYAPFDVTFMADGEVCEVYESLIYNTAIGVLPQAPVNEHEFVGWFDQDGNKVTAETLITRDLTLKAVYAEPHDVTFMVDGEVYETYEDVAYNAVIALPTAPKKVGYDFVKWACGEEEFTAETRVISDLIIKAVYVERAFTADELADYVTVTNKAIGAANSIKHTNSNFGEYVIPTENETSSVVYQFVYTRGEGSLYISMRDIMGGWGSNADGSSGLKSGYIFVLYGAYLQTGFENVNLEVFPKQNGLYLVEIAVIDVKDSSEVYYYVKVDGATVLSGRTVEPASVGNYIGMWGHDGATSTLNEVSCYHINEGVLEAHTVVDVEALPATCTEPGYKAYSYCSVCMADIVAKEIVDELGHEEETVKGYAATCTETGLTDGKKCTVCNEMTVAQTVIDALGHSVQEVAAVAPGCETVGATAGERCIREGCGIIVSGCEEVPAKGHTAVDEEAVPSTCIERGKSAGSHCSECNAVLQAQESLPLADHNYVDGVCSVCGDEDSSFIKPNNPPATDSTDGTSSSFGCFSTISGSMVGITTLIGVVAIFLTKKKEE